MDFRARPRRSLIKPRFNDLEERYPHFMHLYRDYPTDEISYKDFEESASERLTRTFIILLYPYECLKKVCSENVSVIPRLCMDYILASNISLCNIN